MPSTATNYVDSRDRARNAQYSNPSLFPSEGQPAVNKQQHARQVNPGTTVSADRQRQQLAESVKMAVPPTNLKREVGSAFPIPKAAGNGAATGTGINDLEKAAAAVKPKRAPQLDDTESLHSTTTGEHGEDEDQPGTEYGRFSRGMVPQTGGVRYLSTYQDDNEYSLLFGRNWRAELDEEKRLRGMIPSNQDVEIEQEVDHSEQDEATKAESEDENEDGFMDHSKILNASRPLAMRNSAPRFSGSISMAPGEGQRQTQTHQVGNTQSQKPAASDSSLKPLSIQPQTQIKHSARTSSILSSDGENQIPKPQHRQQSVASLKRPHSEFELDYDLSTLAKKSYPSLDELPYTTDPRNPPSSMPALDAHGVPLMLQAKLANLKYMQENDIRSMFEAQTDEEREETGSWFVEQFGEMMKRVQKVRVERRKVALQFEMEIRRRQRTVVEEVGKVTKELDELKQGGGKLIQGRGSSSRGGSETA